MCTSNGVFQFTVFVPATTLEKCIYLERAKCLHIRNHLQKHLLSYFFIVFPAELQAQTPESLINVFRTHVLCEIPQWVQHTSNPYVSAITVRHSSELTLSAILFCKSSPVLLLPLTALTGLS